MDEEEFDITEYKQYLEHYKELQEINHNVFKRIKNYCEGTTLFNRINEELLFQFLFPEEEEPTIEFI